MDKTGAPFNGKHFSNPVPTEVMVKGGMRNMVRQFMRPHPGRFPSKPPGPFVVDPVKLGEATPGKISVTWLGHSTVLFSIDGKHLLTDPVWYQRASPVTKVGPKRFFEVPVALHDLPPLDAVLLSHDHYDHLDKAAIRYLTAQGIQVITMLGVGGRLCRWGISSSLITELDWWQQTNLANGLQITALPARHFSGRSLVDRFTTLWGSFAIRGKTQNVYFGADSGYYEGFKKIGDALGPFDVTMLEIGAYNTNWPQIHMKPEEALQAHLDLRGKLLMPLHWGTFALSFHGWAEPVQRLIQAAEKQPVELLLPAPGETRTVHDGAYRNTWWEK